MSVDPTAMKMGATATAAPPAMTLATSVAVAHLESECRTRMREQWAMPVRLPAQCAVTANSQGPKVLATA